jgi:hypothetical protein
MNWEKTVRTVKTVRAEAMISMNILGKDHLPGQYSTTIFESTASSAPDSDKGVCFCRYVVASLKPPRQCL